MRTQEEEEAFLGDSCVGRGLEVRCGQEDFQADDVDTEAKTNHGPLRRPSSSRRMNSTLGILENIL